MVEKKLNLVQEENLCELVLYDKSCKGYKERDVVGNANSLEFSVDGKYEYFSVFLFLSLFFALLRNE